MTILSLPTYFEWRDPEALDFLCAQLWSSHIEFLVRRIAGHASADTTGRSSAIISQLKSLPVNHFKSILNAPETCHSVYRVPTDGDTQLWNFLDQSILAEKIFLGIVAPLAEPIWNANGSRSFRKSRYSDPVQYESPQFQGLIFDTESPFAKTEITASSFRPEFGSYHPFSKEDLEHVLFHSFAAVEVMSAQSVAPWILINRLVKTVMPRVDKKNFTFKGSSNRGVIGRVNLINPHLEEIGHTQIANSLLHEAIHVILYLLEEQEDFFNHDPEALNGRLQSPWSGNSINPRAYVHGAFVWFGLFMFWLSDNRLNYFDPTIRDYYYEFCSRGYFGGDALKRLESFRHIIRDDVWQALETMDKRMAELAH
ncbi:MAG: HEXXH motif-containing putative peptide modification protein [Candidatus Thiodiazotropha endolucinida]